MEALDVQLEDVARAMDLVMREHLADAIDQVWADMIPLDEAYFAAINEEVPRTPKYHPVKFFLGHHPSILERPATDYPNVTTVAHQHRSAGDEGDQYEVVNNTIYSEAFLLYAEEDALDRMVQRYARAMHRVVSSFPQLSNVEIEPIDQTPNVDVSVATARRLEEFKDDIVYVQGCRVEHTFRTAGLWQ